MIDECGAARPTRLPPLPCIREYPIAHRRRQTKTQFKQSVNERSDGRNEARLLRPKQDSQSRSILMVLIRRLSKSFYRPGDRVPTLLAGSHGEVSATCSSECATRQKTTRPILPHRAEKGPRSETKGGTHPPHGLGPVRPEIDHSGLRCCSRRHCGSVGSIDACRSNNLDERAAPRAGRRPVPPVTAVPIVIGEEPWRERPHLSLVSKGTRDGGAVGPRRGICGHPT
jgi:hypothetical protein